MYHRFLIHRLPHSKDRMNMSIHTQISIPVFDLIDLKLQITYLIQDRICRSIICFCIKILLLKDIFFVIL